MRRFCVLIAAGAVSLYAAERTVDPTFLHRYIPSVEEKAADGTSKTPKFDGTEFLVSLKK